MPDFKTGGVKAVHYSSDGSAGSWTEIAGEMNETSNLPTESIDQETTNSSYQSGEAANPEFVFSDHTDFEPMRDKALGNTRERLFWAIEYFDGRLVKTTQALYPKVVDMPKGKRSDGDSQWKLMVMLDATKAYEDIDSLT